MMKRRFWGMLLVLGVMLALLTTTALAVGDDTGYYYYGAMDDTALMQIAKDYTKAEVIYAAKADERVFAPQCYGGKLYFQADGRSKSSTFSAKLMCMDLTTRQTTMLVDQIAFFELFQGKLYFWRGNAADPMARDLWMCNADGTGLKKTSAVGLNSFEWDIGELNGKIYLSTFEYGEPSKFYQMNLDGTGFAYAFSKSHYPADSFQILFGHKGYLYYVAESIKEVENTGAGYYRTVPGGASEKVADISAGMIAAGGDNLYVVAYNKQFQLMRADLAGKNAVPLGYDNMLIYDLAVLGDGNVYFTANKQQYLFTAATGKAVILPEPTGSTGGAAVSSSTASSTKTIEDVELLSEPTTFDYKVGDKFKAAEISLRVTYTNGTTEDISHGKIKFTANGTKVDSNYRFKEAGKKNVVASWNDYEYKFNITVTASSTKTIEDVELLTEPTTFDYKVGDKFKAAEISLRVTYANGTTEDISHSKIKFTANGTKVDSKYKFKEAGKKNVIVSWDDYEYKFNITVAASSTKTIEDVELLTEPTTFDYKVGDKFKAAEISLRVTYANGTTEDISHSKIKFTANGTKVDSNYKFKEAGKKNVIVSWDDYEYKYSIKVS